MKCAVRAKNGRVPVKGSSRVWERYAWLAGIVYVLALVAVSVVALGVKAKQDNSATKVANLLHEHHERLVVIACLAVVYAPMFLIYLTRLHDLLRRNTTAPRFLSTWVITGGVLFITLHAISDIGITGMVGAKVASVGPHDPDVPYALYLLTFAFDSVADVFGSLFAVAAGWLVIESRVLPRWLGWALILASPFLLLQGFGLGGVIASFGLTLDLIGFLLLLIFIVASSAILFIRNEPAKGAAAGSAQAGGGLRQPEVNT